MLARPGEWQRYYTGTDEEQRLARRYSYSDRMRYYWPDPEIEAAVRRLLDEPRRRGLPDPLLSAFLPAQYDRVRRGLLAPSPRELVIDRVRDVLRVYAAAVTPTCRSGAFRAAEVALLGGRSGLPGGRSGLSGRSRWEFSHLDRTQLPLRRAENSHLDRQKSHFGAG